MNNSSHSALDSSSYIYNPANQRTNLTRTDASTYDFSYDPIGQLKVANSSVNAEDLGFQYDAAWNLRYRTNNGSFQTFTVDTKNQLTNVTPSYTQTHDGNGNLIYNDTAYINDTGYSYDDENRLANWFLYASGINGDGLPTSSSDFRTDFVYDGLGRLRIRVEYYTFGDEWAVASETRYIYDGWRVIQERDGNNTPIVSYTRGSDLSGSLEGAGGIGGLLARTDGDGSTFYHADGNGNVTYLVDSSQALAASYRYDPYGNLLSWSGGLAAANVYRFSSKEVHANSGMYYYGHRFYEPSLQRWLNRDPLGEDGGINLYGFVANDPTDRIDPLGLAEGFILYKFADGSHSFTRTPDTNPNQAQNEAIKTFWDEGGRDAAMMAIPGPEEIVIAKTLEKLGVAARAALIKKWAEAEAAKKAARILRNRCIKGEGKIANKIGRTKEDVEKAIHAAKRDNLRAGGSKRNPDVVFDPETGDLYPEIPGGGLGDSIGTLFQYLPKK